MSPFALKAFPFLAWRHRVNRITLRADVLAGLVGAVMVLPQGVAYATLAGMPPEYGLYGSMLPAIVGALWGSSWHLMSGPTNATSLMVFATVSALAAPFTPGYVAIVLTLNLMVGIVKLGLGVARLGSLVNFISTSVVIGFTAGAGLLIIGAQLRNFFGIHVPQEASFIAGLRDFVTHLGATDPAVLGVGVFTLVAALAGRRLLPRVPYMLTGIVAGALCAWVLSLTGIAHVPTIGALPSAVPPLSMPQMSLQTWQTLAPIALALTVIGLSEAISSARAVALKSGQRIDGNQEFIGQGLANIVGAFTSSYPTSGSFNRTGANYEAGARTPLACVFSAVLLLLILLLVRPLAGYLPVTSMAAVLFIVAMGLIDVRAMRRVWRTSRADALTLAITFIATLTIRLEVAILVGVLASLLLYLNWATHPLVLRVAPDPAQQRRFRRTRADATLCPQLDMLRIDGALFFGSVEHIRDEIEAARAQRSAARHVLLIGTGVNLIDTAGAELLANLATQLREAGVHLYLCKMRPEVLSLLERGGYLDTIGRDRVFATKDKALAAIYGGLDAAKCAACSARIFNECQVTLPDGSMRDKPRPELTLMPRGG
ncbi:MAG TPA: SulP family inorganic anion transporter [Casimicrobiaceae bacterium]|nr:SulP family inorganic anion transporter [Casimicrobiaceae bacterium]